jgi:hypothetical protein
MVVKETMMASSFKVDVQGRDWARLPSLHHITSALAEIPIYGTIRTRSFTPKFRKFCLIRAIYSQDASLNSVYLV